MALVTKISWMTDGDTVGGTLNTLAGCTPVSPGCVNCYAVLESWRKQNNPLTKQHFARTVKRIRDGKLAWTGGVNFDIDKLNAVLGYRHHKCWFVNSLADLFHAEVTSEVVLQHFKVFANVGWQEFRCLTKRAERIVELDPQIKWTGNVHMGVTVEDIAHLYRIALLGKTGARHKFVSFEPWLSPWPYRPAQSVQASFPMKIGGVDFHSLSDLLMAAGIGTVIVGGESAKDKESPRCFNLEDAHYLLEQAEAVGARPVLKQLGDRWAIKTNTYRTNKHGRDRSLWPESLQCYSQEWPFLNLPTYQDVDSQEA